LRDGAVARVLIIGLEGADAPTLSALSQSLAGRLQADRQFAFVHNGAAGLMSSEAALVLDHRYALSPAVSAERFQPAGLRRALEAQLDRLASPFSVAVTPILARDATGEFFEIVQRLQPGGTPAVREGVWFGDEGRRALLTARTQAAGFDLDAQEHALDAIRGAFADVRAQIGGAAQDARLLLAGPAVFAVQSRAAMRSDILTASTIASLGIVGLLFAAFRSLRVVGLILLPVASGTLAGVAAVGWIFGSVHGVTLGFGATLMGEAVDYAIYFFGGAAAGGSPRAALARIWPTLRLGLVTSVVGFGALLLSGFPGLAQLGLFSCVGLVTALLVTRWVLPELAPPLTEPPLLRTLAGWIPPSRSRSAAWRLGLYALTGVCAIWLGARGSQLWNDELAALSPIPERDQQLDENMRRDLQLPDVRHLVVASADSEQSALVAAESVGSRLDALVAQGMLAGYESAARLLPSAAVQRERLDAIPEAKVLRTNLEQALRGLPFRRGLFEPFLQETAAQRAAPPIVPRDLRDSLLGAQVESLLVTRGARSHALLPLRGVSHAQAIEQALQADEPSAVLLDLKAQADALYRTYRQRVVTFSLLGAAAIAVVLALVLRSARRARSVLAPLACAITVTAAVLTVFGVRLTVFHVVALLLVAGVGSNYTLFFERLPDDGRNAEPQRFSLLLCSLSTVIGFAAVGLARTPVLSAIGTTVAMGAALSLLFASMMTAKTKL
jgi:predicted exporter